MSRRHRGGGGPGVGSKSQPAHKCESVNRLAGSPRFPLIEGTTLAVARAVVYRGSPRCCCSEHSCHSPATDRCCHRSIGGLTPFGSSLTRTPGRPTPELPRTPSDKKMECNGVADRASSNSIKAGKRLNLSRFRFSVSSWRDLRFRFRRCFLVPLPVGPGSGHR